MPVQLRTRTIPDPTPTATTSTSRKRGREEDVEEVVVQQASAGASSSPRKKVKQVHDATSAPAPVVGPSSSNSRKPATTKKAKAPSAGTKGKPKVLSAKAAGKQRQVAPKQASEEPEPHSEETPCRDAVEPSPAGRSAKAPSAVTGTTLVERPPGKRVTRRRGARTALDEDDSIETLAGPIPAPTRMKQSRKRVATPEEEEEEIERLLSSPPKRARREASPPQAGPSKPARRPTVVIKAESISTIQEAAHPAVKAEPIEVDLDKEPTPPPPSRARRARAVTTVENWRRSQPSGSASGSRSRHRYNPLQPTSSNEAVVGAPRPRPRRAGDDAETLYQPSLTPPKVKEKDTDPMAFVAMSPPVPPVRMMANGRPERGAHMHDPAFMGSLLKPENRKQRLIADVMLGTKPENRF